MFFVFVFFFFGCIYAKCKYVTHSYYYGRDEFFFLIDNMDFIKKEQKQPLSA
jgi:hypothetical protein